jgi:hypothetical protein
MKNFLMISFAALSMMASGCGMGMYGSVAGVPFSTGGYGTPTYGGAYGPQMIQTPGGMIGTRPYTVVVNVSNYLGRDPGGSRSVSIMGPMGQLMVLRPGPNPVRIPDAPSASLDLLCSNGVTVHFDVSSSSPSLGISTVSDYSCGWGY